MKKHIILSLFIIGTLSLKSFAQTEYFYEFSVPGLTTKTDAANITKLMGELGIFDLRIDEYSGKALCFSNKVLSATDFSEKLNANNYFIFLFNRGIQGTDQHNNLTIDEWNKVAQAQSTEKVFVAIAFLPFSNQQKEALQGSLKAEISSINIKYSNNNKKVLIYTGGTITREKIKQLIYSYRPVNKLNDLVEIYK